MFAERVLDTNRLRFFLQMYLLVLYSIVNVTGAPFRGILLQARTAQDGMPMGKWEMGSNEDFKLLNCNSQASSAVTHANRQDKTNREFKWNIPDVSSETKVTI